MRSKKKASSLILQDLKQVELQWRVHAAVNRLPTSVCRKLLRIITAYLKEQEKRHAK